MNFRVELTRTPLQLEPSEDRVFDVLRRAEKRFSALEGELESEAHAQFGTATARAQSAAVNAAAPSVQAAQRLACFDLPRRPIDWQRVARDVEAAGREVDARFSRRYSTIRKGLARELVGHPGGDAFSAALDAAFPSVAFVVDEPAPAVAAEAAP